MSVDVVTVIAAMAMGMSALLTRQFCHPRSKLYILDYPNERSLHSKPTPRTGGIAIVIAVVIAGLSAVLYLGKPWQQSAWLGGALLLLATTSFIDDRIGLTVGRRIVVHLLVAMILLLGGFVLETITLPGLRWTLPSLVAVPVTLLYIVWMVNLYNFMDGMDGFAGGMAVFGFGVYAVLGLIGGHWLFGGLSLVLTAATTGFLFFNFPPARIFMGDTGSSSLGMLAAAFSIWGAQEQVFPFWVTLLVFSPFIVDATVTMCRRAMRGEKIWQAHRAHYYQRLVQLGWGHRRTVLLEYSVMIACAASALIAVRVWSDVQWAIIGFWIATYVLMAVTVRRLEMSKRKGR